jgi:fimbrial chaperone protein
MTISDARIRFPSSVVVAAGLALAACLPAHGGNWGVSPIRIDLDARARTGLLTITNDDQKRLGFQAKLMEWTQGPDGADQYQESTDLIVFPQMMTIEAGQRRAVRVGSRPGNPSGERAYRLYIEEMRDPADATSGATQVAIMLRFAIPIFVAPPQGEASPEIVAATASPGKIELRIRNTGNRHARFEEITARAGEQVLAQSVAWYVFPGVTRTLAMPVDRERCRAGTIEIRASTGEKTITSTLEATPDLCRP